MLRRKGKIQRHSTVDIFKTLKLNITVWYNTSSFIALFSYAGYPLTLPASIFFFFFFSILFEK